MRLSRSKGSANRRPTFSEQLANLGNDAANRAFARAELLNALAKTTTGQRRNLLYRCKHRILQGLTDRQLVRVTIDSDYQIGLLSVEAPSGRRLHTSESWLQSSQESR